MDELKDPDAEQTVKYNWDDDFQRHIIALLLADRVFLLQSMGLIRPSYFTNKVHSKICQMLFDHFDKYRAVPKRAFLVQEIKKQLKDDKAQMYYLGELTTVYDYYEPGLDSREYLQDKIGFFAKIQAIKKAFHESLELIRTSPEEDEAWSKIHDLLREAMTVDKNFDIGLDYFESVRDRYARQTEEEESQEQFITGFESIDEVVKLGRGEIGAFIADSGVGKSIALTGLASDNLSRGRNVVYVSLELDQDKVAQRFDAMLADQPIGILHQVQNEVFTQLNKIKEECDCQLVIKQFPGGQCDVNNIRAYLSQLKLRGYAPDIVIVDYIGEMKDFPGIPTHESRYRLIRDLRGLAVEEQIAVYTAMQPNRGAKDAQEKDGVIDHTLLADSYAQIRPLDACWSINQNDIENKIDPPVGRMYIIKHRDGKSRYLFPIEFDTKTLKIREVHWDTYKGRMSKYSDKAAKEVAIDTMSNANDKLKRLKDNKDE